MNETIKQLTEEFVKRHAAKYGDGVMKTSWHYINYRIQTHPRWSRLEDSIRATLREKIKRQFDDDCKKTGKVASWENCIEWCEKKGVFVHE